MLASNPITEALEKKDLVNVPTGTSMDLSEMISVIRDEMSQMKKDISLIKDINFKKDSQLVFDTHYTFHDKIKSEEQMLIEKFLEKYGDKAISELQIKK